MGLSLRQARLCLDCDCLTDEQSCPWCDRDGTVPLAGWFRPIDDGKVNATRHGKTTAPAAGQWVLIVQHHQRDLYRVLRQALAMPRARPLMPCYLRPTIRSLEPSIVSIQTALAEIPGCR